VVRRTLVAIRLNLILVVMPLLAGEPKRPNEVTLKGGMLCLRHSAPPLRRLLPIIAEQLVPPLEKGRLVGLVSIGDVVKMRISEAEMEAAALREYTNTG
jgi:hypothetical protein